MVLRFAVRFTTPTVMRRDADAAFMSAMIDGRLTMLADGTGDDGHPTNGDAVYLYTGGIRPTVMRSHGDDGTAQLVDCVRRVLAEVRGLANDAGGVSRIRVHHVGMGPSPAPPAEPQPEPAAEPARG